MHLNVSNNRLGRFGKIPLALPEPYSVGVRTVSLALPITYTHFVVMVTPLLLI